MAYMPEISLCYYVLTLYTFSSQAFGIIFLVWLSFIIFNKSSANTSSIFLLHKVNSISVPGALFILIFFTAYLISCVIINLLKIYLHSLVNSLSWVFNKCFWMPLVILCLEYNSTQNILLLLPILYIIFFLQSYISFLSFFFFISYSLVCLHFQNDFVCFFYLLKFYHF